LGIGAVRAVRGHPGRRHRDPDRNHDPCRARRHGAASPRRQTGPYASAW